MEAIFNEIIIEKYSAYKDSGVKWIEEIPEHWNVTALGRILFPVSLKNRPDLPLLSITREKGVILRNLDDEEENHNYIPDDLSNYKILKEGQFGMNKMKAWQGSYGISKYTGIVSPAYYIFDLVGNFELRFFHLAIRSNLYISFFQSASDGVRIGQWDLSKDRMRKIPFLGPPKDEQIAIARFIDTKTALIDKAITIKEKQIELLKERLQILIHQVVTKGLNRSAKLKDSGVEWIGEIPEHWEVKKLKYVLKSKLQYGANESGVEYDHNLPRYIRITDFSGDGKLSDNNKLSLPWKIGKDYLLNDGDILFARSGATVGKSYIFKASMSNDRHYCFAGYLIKAEANEVMISSSYLYLFTNSKLFEIWKDTVFSKATIENIGADKYALLPIILPPISEQRAILGKVEIQTHKISDAISLKEQEMQKLKEYKFTLINSAVTGKIKVT